MVYMADSSVSRICHNPMFASTMLNFFALASIPRLYSTGGRMYFSQHTYTFTPVRSTLKRKDCLFFFATTTTAVHHSVAQADDAQAFRMLEFFLDVS